MDVVRTTLWYMMDHTTASPTVPSGSEPDMRHLTKPRGKGYTLRLTAPDVLVGTENPLTGKPFGREIKLGLNTRNHAEAVRLRDIRLGQIRQLEADALAHKGKRSVGKIIDLSPENAAEWRQMREEADDPDSVDFFLTDQLEKADRAGKANEVQTFAGIVFRGAIPLQKALDEYLHDRRAGNPHGFDALSITTALNVRSTVKHLRRFFGEIEPTLSDITPDIVFKFRTDYLPIQVGLTPQTVAKHMTLLRGMWKWAIVDKQYLKGKSGKPIRNPWIVEETGTSKKKASKPKANKKRTAFTPDDVAKLLGSFSDWGSRQGDIMRLALATGCRVDEVGSLTLGDVEGDGSGFSIRHGKTDNAIRFIPVVSDAQRLLAERIANVIQLQGELPSNQRRLFPEWTLKPSTGKVNGVSQWFTRYRRRTLGEETDGRLVMHSFRHTWRTVARRAGVAEDRIRELGGWEGEKDTADGYDHGLLKEQLELVQLEIWNALEQQGFLSRF